MKEDLIIDNINLVYYVLKNMKLINQKDYYTDIGMYGLVKAACNYDPDKGFSFATYAIKCIENEILMEIRSSKTKTNANTYSYDNTVYDSDMNEVRIGDLYISDVNIEEDLINKEKLEMISKAIEILSKDEKELIICYYSNHKLTQVEIAKKLNISQAHVSRRLKQVIKKLKSYIEYTKYFEDYE